MSYDFICILCGSAIPAALYSFLLLHVNDDIFFKNWAHQFWSVWIHYFWSISLILFKFVLDLQDEGFFLNFKISSLFIIKINIRYLWSRIFFLVVEQTGSAFIELHKKTGSGLGLIVSGKLINLNIIYCINIQRDVLQVLPT